jgi:hypothetical protein
VSIHALLSAALNEAVTFQNGTPAEIRSFVIEAKASVKNLEPIIAALHTRRNQTIAHADFRALVDPKAYIAAARMSYGEFERLFLKIGSILNNLSMLYRGASVELEMPDWRDYEQAFDLIAEAKCEKEGR